MSADPIGTSVGLVWLAAIVLAWALGFRPPTQECARHMASKRIVVDFYQVNMPVVQGRRLQFGDLLREIFALPQGTERTLTLSHRTVRFHEGRLHAAIWEGETVRIELEVNGVKYSTDGDRELLLFDEDEGLGVETAFLFHPGLSVLVIQRNRSGVNAGLFAQYCDAMLAQLRQIDAHIDFRLIASRAMMEKLVRMDDVRQIEVKFSHIGNMHLINDSDPSLRGLGTIWDSLRAGSVSLKVKAPRGGGMRKNAILRFARDVRDLVQSHNVIAPKFEVKGLYDDEHQEEFDILADFVREVAFAPPDENGLVPYTDRITILRNAFQKRHAEIRAMLERPEGDE